MNKFEGQLVLNSNNRVAILAARFNQFVVNSLLEGAIDTLKRHGLPEENMDVIYVPGAYELPLAAKHAAMRQYYSGIVALGVVIRGGTPHFEYVSSSCIQGLSRVGLDHGLPIGLGVLTVDTIDQAIERAGTKAGNKGEEAAMATIEMINLGQVFSSNYM